METPSGPPVREKVHSRSRGGAAARRGGRTIKDNTSGPSLSLLLRLVLVYMAHMNHHGVHSLRRQATKETHSRSCHLSLPPIPLYL
jgi:hypothetical protein